MQHGNVPKFITKACQTIIDLTLVSDSLVGAVKNWAVSDEHSFSDHRFIETVLSIDSPLPVSFARSSEVLTNILPMETSESITNPQELDEAVYKFTEACNTAFKVACHTGKPGEVKNPPGGPNNYQFSEPTADACLTELRREIRTLTGRTTIMN